MSTEIKILDTVNDILGTLDMDDTIQSPFKISKSSATISNIKARSGTFSTSFTVPNTNNNNKLLQNIKNINQDVTTKNILDRKEAAIYEDGLLVERGFIKIKTVINKDGVGGYEIVFFGDNLKWATEAEELKLNDINFRNNTFTLTEANIKAAQAGTYAGGYDFTFALINRGQYHSDTTLTVEDFYPDLYIKAIVERGLNQLGYVLESDFMDSSAFERLIFPFNGVFAPSDTLKEDNITQVKTTSDITIDSLDYGQFSVDTTPNPNKNILIAKRIKFQGIITDQELNYDSSTGYYTAPFTGTYKMKGTIKYRSLVNKSNFCVFVVKGTTPSENIYVTQQDFQDNSPFDIDGLNSYIHPNALGYWQNVNARVLNFSAGSYEYDYEYNFDLDAGDVVSLYVTTDVRFPNLTNYGDELGTPIKILAGTTMESYFVSSTFSTGTVVSVADLYDSDTTLLDVINDITRMFNLYFETNNNNRTVRIEPRDSFYKSIEFSLDWSDKIDLKKEYTIDYIEQYPKELIFKYKKDSSDGYVEGWEKEKNLTLAEYKHELPERFEKGTANYELDLFCPSMHIIDGKARYKIAGVGKPITARFWKHYNKDETYPDFSTEFAPRILNYVYGTQTDYAGNPAQIHFNEVLSNIPAALFESYEYVNAPMNLNWNGADGLFATYYSITLKHIESTPRASAYFDLNSSDIRNFSFRNPIYLEYPSELKGYYVVESIENFDFKKNTIKVNLLKYINVDPVSINTAPVINSNISSNQKNDVTTSTKGQLISINQEWGSLPPPPLDDAGISGDNPSTVLQNNSGNQTVKGSGSVVWGVGLTSTGYYQTIYGVNNIPDPDAQVIIGGGTKSEPANAITIKDGNVQFFGGQVYIQKTLADTTKIWLPVVIVGNDDKLQNVYLSE